MRGVRASDYSQNTLGVNFNKKGKEYFYSFPLYIYIIAEVYKIKRFSKKSDKKKYNFFDNFCNNNMVTIGGVSQGALTGFLLRDTLPLAVGILLGAGIGYAYGRYKDKERMKENKKKGK